MEAIAYSNTRGLGGQKGFTLVEVMVALGIFMMIMLGLAKSEFAAVWAQSGSVYRDEALRLAEDELTRLKAEQFSLAGTSSQLAPTAWTTLEPITVALRKGSLTYVRSIQVTDIAASASEMKRIDVAVGWTRGKNAAQLAPTNRNNQVSVSTVIVRTN